MSATPELASASAAENPIKDEASLAATPTTAATENGGDAAADTGDVPDEAKEIDAETAKALFQEQATAYLVEQQQHVIIPSYAAWFNLNDIHVIEKKLFPDFFQGKATSTGAEENVHRSVYKTAKVYRDMRDFMINAYRVNPLEYLTVTAVRRNLAGDVSSLIRIHHFLEKWGLINYQIDPRTKSSVVGPQYTGHFQITLDTPSGLVPFLPKKVVEPGEPSTTTKDDQSPTVSKDVEIEPSPTAAPTTEVPLNLEVRRNVYTKANDLAKRVPISSVQFFCNVCGKECTQTRYHNLRAKSFHNNPNSASNSAAVICVNCYDQGLFPLNFYSSDFLKLKEEVDVEDVWTEQETLLLLEAIEMYASYDASTNLLTHQHQNVNNGQWDKISEHIGTKSKEECLVKFIQLPIEDRYLSKLVKPTSKKRKGDADGPSSLAIEEIVSGIIANGSAKNVATNAANYAKETSADEQGLIDQIIELTLEKVSIKLSNIDQLEQNLLEAEKKLQQERKQVLYERWSQFEKINNYKESNPELTPLLDELLTPIKFQEIEKLRTTTGSPKDKFNGKNGDDMQVDSDASGIAQTNPVSLSNPKSYQFWSG